MSEPDNGTPQPKKPEKKEEMSMETRLLLSFVLMGVVLFATQYLFKPTPPDKTTVKQTEPVVPKVQGERPPPPPPPSVVPAEGVVAASRDEDFTV
ncbi:MAG: hypothetical protein ABI822_24005, partial [Bryobacteraceae bacterium]